MGAFPETLNVRVWAALQGRSVGAAKSQSCGCSARDSLSLRNTIGVTRCSGARRTSSTTLAWCGDLLHTGSAWAASPVIRKAWQRQPPKSLWRSSQLLQGGFIQLVAPVGVKGLAARPDVGQRLVLHTRQIQARQVAGVVAGQRGAIRGDGQKDRAPAIHAGLGALFKIVGHHEQHPAARVRLLRGSG